MIYPIPIRLTVICVAGLLWSGFPTVATAPAKELAFWKPWQRKAVQKQSQAPAPPPTPATRPRYSGKPEKPSGTTGRTTPARGQLPVPDTWHEPAPPRPLPTQDGNTVIIFDFSDPMRRLAAACDTSIQGILDSNCLKYQDLRAGQALVLPAPAPPENGSRLPASFAPGTNMQREVWRGVRRSGRIALTFDAGGEPDGAQDLLRNLREEGVRATFFVTGSFTRKHPDVVKGIAAEGHPVHNHSWSHPEFTRLSDERIVEELGKADSLIREATGKPSLPFWRPPFGDRDRRVLRTAAAYGYQSIYWTIDTLDSVGDTKDAKFIVDRVLNFPRAGGNPDDFLDGAIILMHVGEPRTVEAVPGLIRRLRERGFRFVTVEEILQP